MSPESPARAALRFRLGSGVFSVPLHRVHHLVGYAALNGEPDDYFAGWLLFHGEHIPVFDLNRVICDQSTAETFGSRIMIIDTDGNAATPHIGLLAPELTNTVSPEETDVTTLHLDSYLPMLYPLIPVPPDKAIA